MSYLHDTYTDDEIAEFDDTEFVSDVTNEFGNIDEKKEYPAYSPLSSETIDYYITSQATQPYERSY